MTECAGAAEEIISGKPFPAWSGDTETVVFRSMGIPDPNAANPYTSPPLELYLGVRADGTLIFSGNHMFMNEGHVRE